jgi:hypothetical protein
MWIVNNISAILVAAILDLKITWLLNDNLTGLNEFPDY